VTLIDAQVRALSRDAHRLKAQVRAARRYELLALRELRSAT
jgi:hypothetical protein